MIEFFRHWIRTYLGDAPEHGLAAEEVHQAWERDEAYHRHLERMLGEPRPPAREPTKAGAASELQRALYLARIGRRVTYGRRRG